MLCSHVLAFTLRYAAPGLLLVGVALLAGNCSTPSPQHTLNISRTVDLTHIIAEDIPHRATDPPIMLERIPGSIYPHALRIGVRGGTSLTLMSGKPGHQPTVDLLSPADLVAPAVVIDLRDQIYAGGRLLVEVGDIMAWEQRNGQIPPGAVVLLASGWDLRWGDQAHYLNLDAQTDPPVPGFSPAAATLLLNERGVRALGSDTPCVLCNDLYSSGNLALPEEWYVLENLTNLEQLPPTGAYLVVGSLRLQASPASPARVLALVP